MSNTHSEFTTKDLVIMIQDMKDTLVTQQTILSEMGKTVAKMSGEVDEIKEVVSDIKHWKEQLQLDSAKTKNFIDRLIDRDGFWWSLSALILVTGGRPVIDALLKIIPH